MEPLFPFLLSPPDKEALRFGARSISYRELRDAAGYIAEEVATAERVAIWAEPELETCVAVLGTLVSGAAVVPINPKIGHRDLNHVFRDSQPGLVLARRRANLPPPLARLPRLNVDVGRRSNHCPSEASSEAPAFVLYTSGTTGPPKGAILPRRAISTNLDALAEVWEWTSSDVLVHGLPLFHAHGLVLGVLGPIRLGATLHHVGRFSPEAVCSELAERGTMLFGVPTMYHRLADAVEQSPNLAYAVSRARLLVSGSAALPVREYERIQRATGQRIVERYGLTETLMNCAIRASGDRRPGYVGPPLPGVDVKLVREDGTALEVRDDETIGELLVRGPNVFTEYLNRPEATERAFRDGWFLTGDLATRAENGYVRIVGRLSTDLIKTGGFKVGAGEVETALLDHPDIAEAAVVGEDDVDLGERIVAWVVPKAGTKPSTQSLVDHVAQLLAPHKRPRSVYVVDALPRNDMGKILKSRLRSDTGAETETAQSSSVPHAE